MKKVFIFGYYGFKNIGDEAILSSIIKTIRDLNIPIEISALSYNVRYTEKIHNIKGIRRNNLKEILTTIKNSDLVISGGGSLLQDVTSSRSLIYYLGLIFLAKCFGKKVLFFSNGFGPVNKTINKYLVKHIVNKVDKIILRDYDSKDTMKDVGIKVDIEVTSDATYILEASPREKIDTILSDENIPRNRPIVAISVRSWNFSNDFIKVMANFSDYIVERGYTVLFVPMQIEKDTEISKKIIKKMKNNAYIIQREYTPQEILGIIGVSYILIGMRLHSLIFASIQNIPMMGIEYDPKIKSFLNMINQKNLGTPDELKLSFLCSEFDKLIKNYEHNLETVKSRSKILKNKTEANKKCLYKIISDI
ncbi:polysaccharide pyruvyl transferase CsaB [Caminicella sporogenes]|uniref:polysaccharide pyruvyl transferase CsaB n=1 Tax=Caminicella sporogenes TaxID=166485 RepID=UPI0025408A3F|nr:polysaccharide pyruvyl transferase CsaB [Caminicella sporogenes]WIF95313.1 polysaccharide pyruvyl transferase CsaB [Caminicella sporogenes]